MARASVEAIERMSQNIRKGITAESAIADALKSDYAIVGNEWDDPKYQELGGVINDAVRELSGNQAKLEECVTKLQLLKTKLEEYLSTHM